MVIGKSTWSEVRRICTSKRSDELAREGVCLHLVEVALGVVGVGGGGADCCSCLVNKGVAGGTGMRVVGAIQCAVEQTRISFLGERLRRGVVGKITRAGAIGDCGLLAVSVVCIGDVACGVAVVYIGEVR